MWKIKTFHARTGKWIATTTTDEKKPQEQTEKYTTSKGQTLVFGKLNDNKNEESTKKLIFTSNNHNTNQGKGNEENNQPKSQSDEIGQFIDNSPTLPGAAESKLARVTWDKNLDFLHRPTITRAEGLTRMSRSERLLFEYMVLLRPISLLRTILKFPQKSAPWKWARTGRLTGSLTGAAVGQLRQSRVVKSAWSAIYKLFKGNVATEWGSGKEVYATQCHVNDLQRLVTLEFRRQRAQGLITTQKRYFLFRNQKIPVKDIHKDPVVEVRHFALLIDPFNHWRGVSPDGVIFINGVAAGALEAKCAYAKRKSLYVNIKPYYFNQLQCEMYMCRQFWPEIRWVDFVVWTPTGFTVETMTFDADYFYSWYGPRELRYYFELYLPALAERMRYLARLETNDFVPSEELYLKILHRELSISNPAPPT